MNRDFNRFLENVGELAPEGTVQVTGVGTLTVPGARAMLRRKLVQMLKDLDRKETKNLLPSDFDTMKNLAAAMSHTEA